jgi:hypothetical protein
MNYFLVAGVLNFLFNIAKISICIPLCFLGSLIIFSVCSSVGRLPIKSFNTGLYAALPILSALINAAVGFFDGITTLQRTNCKSFLECGTPSTIYTPSFLSSSTWCNSVPYLGSDSFLKVFSFNCSRTESPSFISSYFLTLPLFFIFFLTVSISSFLCHSGQIPWHYA